MLAGETQRNRVLAELRSGWTDLEREERRLLATQKQRWLCDMIGIDEPCHRPEQPTPALAVAG